MLFFSGATGGMFSGKYNFRFWLPEPFFLSLVLSGGNFINKVHHRLHRFANKYKMPRRHNPSSDGHQVSPRIQLDFFETLYHRALVAKAER
jgi:hypothetical protein